MGYFLGFFLHAAVAMGDFGWLAAEIGVGLVVATVVRFALFYPRQRKALERTQRSYFARARRSRPSRWSCSRTPVTASAPSVASSITWSGSTRPPS